MNKTAEERKQQLSSFWDTGPGPGGYMLPPTVGYANHDFTKTREPAYSLGLQLPSTLIRKNNGPGPIYAIPQGLTARGNRLGPAYTLRARTKIMENFNTETPGPAAYLPNINVNRRKPPAAPLSWRTRVNEKGRFSPGPIYLLPSALGPKIPDKSAAAECTIKGKGKTEDEFFRSPGPIYDVGSPNIVKNKCGAASIKGRWKPLKSQSGLAGPGSYNVSPATPRVWRKPPAFSFGIRHSAFAGNMLTSQDKEDNAIPSAGDC